ncbi:MAG: hypothetical protein LC721_00145, partial [Actinobacteria bacterium]|nr:hypothetical protein [Actinomycetota bacterium]
KAIVDAANDEMKAIRTDHTTQLIQRYEEEGNSSWKVKLPDGTVVASINLKVPKKAATVADEEAFLAWVESTHPKAIQSETIAAVPEQVIPAQPERVVKSVSGKAMTELEKHFDLTADGVVDTTTGTIVDGMVVVPAAKPSSFEVRYETAGGGGRADLALAYRTGKLNHVVTGTTLPAIESAPMVERRLEAVPDPVVVQGETVPELMDEDRGLCGAGCSGCSICDPDGDYSRFQGDGDEGWRASPVADQVQHDLEKEFGDDAVPADDFDPGDFGTPLAVPGGW